MYYQIKNSDPSAYITRGKLRLRQHGTTVYLKNQTEFEIELFNPQAISVLAKIKLNGHYISGGGIVLKPGQRVFLERHLDTPNKFVFETYNVDANDSEVANAILNNGEVVVEFYPELYLGTTSSTISYYGSTMPTYSSNPNYNTFTTTNISSSFGATSTTTGVDFGLKETGTIEKGSRSKQEFINTNKTFANYYTSCVTWKILPESVKPYETKDLVNYCTECGSKIKKSTWKYCPNCGSKVN